MVELDELLNRLGYKGSPHYKLTDRPADHETAHLFRAARDAGVRGIYVFEASVSSSHKLLAPRPAVYLAQANTEDEARQIHRSLWNLGYAPFLIVLLPHQVRIYTGFNYSEGSIRQGLLGEAESLSQVVDLLSDFKASSIDAGLIWKSRYYTELDQSQRVDRRLLANLEQLGESLVVTGLPERLSHSLIGKYVYLSYLRSCGILTDEWMTKRGIAPQSVFSPEATVSGLQLLSELLEDRFNGRIFPIEFEKESTLQDRHVSWVASVFSGSKVVRTAPQSIQQLHLPFQAYDFRYIPVETLSAIYEQFIRDRKEKGAIYTPEVLADYLLSEMEWVRPLQRGMKVLDPACGSGVFLVLAYRRLIEKEMQLLDSGEKLNPEILRDILLESIYGIEREHDACFVAEFSLILTLLHYVEPCDLENLDFKFPSLHNNRVFEGDFFDTAGETDAAKFWGMGLRFDWIVGNPPWIEVRPGGQEAHYVHRWMQDPNNRREHPVGGKRVAEAFSWLVTDLLSSDGFVGLVLPATSLFDVESTKYRQSFFSKHEVLRITNFANLRDVLFGRDKSGVLPAATVIYRLSTDGHQKPDIVHYGPFSINQVPGARNKPWVITVNENEIQLVSAYEAEQGEMLPWKFALWGTYRDRRAVERIRHLFPTTLQDFCKEKGWGTGLPRQGAELRDRQENPQWPKAMVKGTRRFDTKIFDSVKPRYRFSIPDNSVLQEITQEHYVRRGEDTLRITTPAPHVILSASWRNFAIFSNEDFVVPPRQMAISAPKVPKENAEYLRALTIYLSSSLVAYYLFFQVPQWAIFSQRGSVITTEVRKIPMPDFTRSQVIGLSSLHREIVIKEARGITDFVSRIAKQSPSLNDMQSTGFEKADQYLALARTDKQKVNDFASQLEVRLQLEIDEEIFRILDIPEDIRVLASEFVQTRLLLDKPSIRTYICARPTEQQLLDYAQELQKELDSFLMGMAHHIIHIVHSKDLIQCIVEVVEGDSNGPLNQSNIKAGGLDTSRLLGEISQDLREQVSQWVYVQRGLRLYDGPRVHIYKTPRLIDWTRTQAMHDAADIIGHMVTST